jgi:hypothetical protein
MKKNIFEVGQEEKNRILSLHESATKNLYLSESEEMISTYDKEEVDKGTEISNKLSNSDNLTPKYWIPLSGKPNVNPFEAWAEWSGLKDIRKALGNVYNYTRNVSVIPVQLYGQIGRYFMKNQEGEQKVNEIISKSPQEMMDLLHREVKI